MPDVHRNLTLAIAALTELEEHRLGKGEAAIEEQQSQPQLKGKASAGKRQKPQTSAQATAQLPASTQTQQNSAKSNKKHNKRKSTSIG